MKTPLSTPEAAVSMVVTVCSEMSPKNHLGVQDQCIQKALPVFADPNF